MPLPSIPIEKVHLKGKYLGYCNRIACLAPGANWVNPNNQNLYYCESCALLLNRENHTMPYWKLCYWPNEGVIHLEEFLDGFHPNDQRKGRFLKYWVAKNEIDPIHFPISQQQLSWEEDFLQYWDEHKDKE